MSKEVKLFIGLEDFLTTLLCCEGPPRELHLMLVDKEKGIWKGEITFRNGKQVKITYLEALYTWNGKFLGKAREDTILAKFEGFKESRTTHIIKRVREVREALERVFV